MPLRPGETLSHYRLVEQIGKGGMGVVWKAEDIKLGRKVALKVLPDEMASDPERLERFQREARALAALDHPGIVTVHSVEQADGLHFLTMNLVEGRRLDDEIPQGGMPVERLFEIGIALADALASAHDRGVTHRDLKPANVMLTSEGRVKVVDFGLAKIAGPPVGSLGETATMMQTREGVVVGTAPYMSPEQVQGKRIDHRTDIFSLGVLLYQMATGRLPFRGDNTASVVSAVMRDAPEPVTSIRADLPSHLGRVILRCLEKDPERRFQTTKDLRIELEGLKREIDSGPLSTGSMPAAAPTRTTNWWPVVGAAVLLAVAALWWGLGRDAPVESTAPATPADAVPATPAPSRVVVLPFENLGTAEDDYFAAGMTEELTSRLAAVAGLAVISRKSAQQYAGTTKGIPEIGEELGVTYVVAGTVRWARSGDGASRVRITPELIEVAADTQVWSSVYDREMDDVFQIQSEIAQQIVQQLGVKLGGSDRANLDARPTRNVEAYQAYLRGNYFVDLTVGIAARRFDQAIENYEKAVELDPGFVEAWVRLSMTHSLVYHSGYDVSDDRHEAARRALDELIRIAPDSGETHLARGYYYYWGFKDYERGLVELRRAAELLPGDTLSLLGQAYILRRKARWEETIARLEQVAELDPRNSSMYYDIGTTETYAGRYTDALASFDLSLAIQPDSNPAGGLKAYAFWLWKGRDGLAAAREALENSFLDSKDEWVFFFRYWQSMYEARPEAAIAVLREGRDQEWLRTSDTTVPVRLYEALALELVGRDDEARGAFEDAVRLLEAEIERTPEDFRLPGSLGLAYAGLGRRAEAIAAAERGVAMIPLEKDSMLGPLRVWELAAVHARVGDPDVAIDLLKKLIRFSGGHTFAWIDMDPRMAPLRSHPRYRELAARTD
jgi:non-specific serine/threonine protein kinase